MQETSYTIKQVIYLLRWLVNEKKVSAKRIAEDIGCTRDRIYYIVNSPYKPSKKLCDKIINNIDNLIKTDPAAKEKLDSWEKQKEPPPVIEIETKHNLDNNILIIKRWDSILNEIEHLVNAAQLSIGGTLSAFTRPCQLLARTNSRVKILRSEIETNYNIKENNNDTI